MLVERLLPATRERLAVIGDHARVVDAAAMLANQKFDLVAVCSADGAIVGVTSKTDIVRHIAQCRGRACQLAVPGIMTRDVLSCSPRDWLHDVWSVMKDRGLRCVPIVDERSKPLGILHVRDALQALLAETQDEEQLLRDYVMCAGYH